MTTKVRCIVCAMILCCGVSLSAQKKGILNTVNNMRDVLTKMMSESIETKKTFTIIVDQAIFTDDVFNPAGRMVFLDDLEDDLAPTGDEEAGTVRFTRAPFFLSVQGDTVGINLPYTRITERNIAKIEQYTMEKSKKGKFNISFDVKQPRSNYHFDIKINSAGTAKIVVTGKNPKQPLTFYGNASFPSSEVDELIE